MIEFKNRLELMDHKIHQAMRGLDIEKAVSQDAKNAIHRLTDKSEELLRTMNEGSPSPKSILKDVEELEELGDQVKAAVRPDQEKHAIDNEHFQMVIDAHNSIRQLRNDLRQEV